MDSTRSENFSNRLSVFLRLLMLILFVIAVFCLSACSDNTMGILNPKGIIAYKERKLLVDTLALMLIVVLPVIIMSFTFVYHYQVSHRIKDYKPNWAHSYFLESLWWGIPCVIIVVLAVLTWKKTYELDPYATIADNGQPPLLIHVIALPWKWLFIYPEQGIATVNYLTVPVGQQVEYWMTTDNVPMSAFFIPQLGSQIYAMAGMRSRLHLIANEVGVYEGLNTQFNGDGFSDMHFPVHVVQPEEMEAWVMQVKSSPEALTNESYLELLKPTMGDPPKYFSKIPPNLFNGVVQLYMTTYGKNHPRENLANGV